MESSMSRVIQFSKNHWKKLGLAAVPTIYGAKYIKDEYGIYKHMRNVCKVVNQCSPSKASNIVVVLNPVANKKRCEKMFKKYCEPVLHMAGYAVNIIKTKHVGHAKSLLETLNQLPDAIVVAGGDGTSSEVVTGLLRRNSEVCPILFLPLGEENKTVSGFLPKENKGKIEFVKYLSNFVLALIQERIKVSPVVKYEIIQTDNLEEKHKPIFGLQGLSWGVLSDLEICKERYWYFGSLRYHAAVIALNVSKQFDKSVSAKLICKPPCSGCSKCVIPLKTKRRSYFSTFFKQHESIQPFKQEIFKTGTCGIETLYNITGKQVEIICNKNMHSFFELNANVIENISDRNLFLIKILKKIGIEPTALYKGHTIELHPLNSEHQTYYIDGEGYDARPIKISFLPNAVKYFC